MAAGHKRSYINGGRDQVGTHCGDGPGDGCGEHGHDGVHLADCVLKRRLHGHPDARRQYGRVR